MNFRVSGLLIFLITAGCGNRVGNETLNGTGYMTAAGINAKGFSISESSNGYVLTVRDPWQQAENTTYTYRLTRDSSSADNLKTGDFEIGIPVKKVVCLSTTHTGFISKLGEIPSVAGISGSEMVIDSELRAQIDSNLIPDIGYDENLNYELLIDLKPDLVFAYGINASVNRMVARLAEFGIPVILVAEYLEEDPLAKAEWIKFFGCFFDKLDTATEIFEGVADEYNRLKETALDVKERPLVLTGLPWQGTWYVSGGSSYIATLLSDAGGDYLWSDQDFRDSRPVSLEKVYERAVMARYWLNTGSATSLREIAGVDKRFENLNVFHMGNIFNNNAILNNSGGNGYYESGVMEPHIILADLISILQPQLLPSHKPKYYQQLH